MVEGVPDGGREGRGVDEGKRGVGWREGVDGTNEHQLRLESLTTTVSLFPTISTIDLLSL